MTIKQELLKIIGNNKILCATIYIKTSHGEKQNFTNNTLEVCYKPEELFHFFNNLDFKTTWQVGGTIWLQNGEWISRKLDFINGDTWEYNCRPYIPIECLPN